MKSIKFAIIDFYNGEVNQDIPCLEDLVKETNEKYNNLKIEYDVFDIRRTNNVPSLEYDIFFSSGGPGSPFEGKDKIWEKKYFNLLDKIVENNLTPKNDKKYVFFICYSFQLAARYFNYADVSKRHSESFGIKEIYKTEEGKKDILLSELNDLFLAVDFRSFQVVNSKQKVLDDLGAKIIALEKERPHLPYERALMAVRISDELFATQFHPEADGKNMLYQLRKEDRKEYVINKKGIDEYERLIEMCEDKDGIELTSSKIIPTFIENAIKNLIE